VDKYLAYKIKEYSREFFKVLCKKRYVKINNNFVEPDTRVKTGDIVEVHIPERSEYTVGVENKISNIKVIYEDSDLIVLNKPPFLKVHPAKKFDTEVTLVDWLYKYCPQSKNENWFLERPFLVHRLDKDTSGVIVVAKNSQAQYLIAKQFQNREVKKVYRAIVVGSFDVLQGEIVAPVHVVKNVSKVSNLGKNALTKFKVLSSKNNFSYLELYPVTGRTHQIRTHLSFINHPVIGDKKYGGVTDIAGKLIPRYMLHAYSIKFYHFRRAEWVKFTAELPEDFKFFLSYLSLEV